MKTILITGVTGFIGANLLERLLTEDYLIIGIKRTTSNTWRIDEFKNNPKLKLINIDEIELKKIFNNYSVDTVIHAAWCGVKADERNTFQIQLENFNFSTELFLTAAKSKVKKIVSFGSQAEYGFYSGRINETYPLNPYDAYGQAKVYTYNVLIKIVKEFNIDWNWFRIFSIFGPKEDTNWLISSSIKKMLKNEDINLTLAEQKYDYLFVNDFTNILVESLNSKLESGVYNISSNSSIVLKEMILTIKNITKSKSKLNFGALEYRKNQVMHMEGDSNKLHGHLNYNLKHFEDSIRETINYYKEII